MQFDTGPDVHPGTDISVATSAGTEQLGSATYDSDHDGVADSIILIDGGHEYVITDSDHDGVADSMRQFDSTGREVVPELGGSGDQHPTGSGGVSGAHGAGGSDRADGLLHEPGALAGIGSATVDLDGDGTPDTAVDHLDDGTVVGYSDTDGDGLVDRMARIAPDGRVVLAVADGAGGWRDAATGHLDPAGLFVPDAAV